MLNRPTAQAESQDLSRDLEVKVTRRAWNPALHPRDSKGRFIETGGTVRLWGGKLARVVRALPHDRILVQDQSGPNEFRGRRHTTSAKWVSMVARPDGSAPTADEEKVAEQDEKRTQDPRRGNGVARDDDGDADTPNDPHDQDDQGRPIGDDDGDGPDDDDDQDEPEDGAHPVNVGALPNQQHAAGARHADTAAVRRHLTQVAAQPGTSPDMATFLRSVAYDDDLRTTPSGRLAILRDDRPEHAGRWYLTATGTGQRVDAAGDFDTAEAAALFAEHLDKTAVNGQLTQFNQPFDFSDPQLDQAARDWRSTKGENIQGAIQRARQEFDGTPPAPAAVAAKAPADSPTDGDGQRFSTLQAVRAHWQQRLDQINNIGPDSIREQRAARHLEGLISNDRIKLVGRDQFVVGKDQNGEWYLAATGSGLPLRRRWTSQQDAQAFAQSFTENAPMGDDGKPLDLSDPNTRIATWRSDDNRSISEVIDAAAEKFQRDNATEGAPPATPETPAAPQAPQTPETPEAPEAPALPGNAEPVEGVDGYHYVNDGGSVTLYGPDGQVAATSERGYPPKAKIEGVTVPVPQYPKQGAAVMARLHRAAQNPDQRDRITAAWVMKPGKEGKPAKRVMVFRGTIKGDERDYDAVGSTRAIKWAPSLRAYSTQSNMTEATRDERISEVLSKLARQGRNIHITDETAAGTPGAPANAVDETEALRKAIAEANDTRLSQLKHERWGTLNRTRSEATRKRLNSEIELINEELKRRRKERDEAAARDATSLSDEDIANRIRESQEERGTYGSRKGQEANDVERAIYSERRRRSQALTDDDTDLTTMAEDDLVQAREAVAERVRMHQAAGDDAEAERTMRQALQSRHDAIVGEQQRRHAEQIADRPPVGDLTNEELSAEYNELLRRDFRKAPPEAQQVLEGRMEDVKRERRDREKRAITDRDAPENLTDKDLAAEYTELARARSSYSETDDVKAARKERMAVLEAEQNRRSSTPEVDQLVARVDNPDDNGMISVDGRSDYGYVDYRDQTHGHTGREIGWTWGKHSWGHADHAYPSRAAALAAMVQAYDNDPDTRGERTWGRKRRVFVPKMFVELYQNERLRDRLADATQERQYLFSLFRDRYGWDDGVNPLVPSNKKGHHIKGRNLHIPEGLLAELHRVTEELSREMSIRATDRDADSSDRQKAKTRLASINVALHGIEAMRERVRNNGGNDDQKVISREEIEAQQAALREALGGDDDEHVQPDGSGALGDAPAEGVGGDGRSGGVRDDEGPGDRDGNSGGGGGAGEGGSGADGVRSGGRPDQADQSGRDGDGPGGASAGAGARGGEDSGADTDGEAPAGDQGPDVRRVAGGRRRRGNQSFFRPDPAKAPKGARARAAANVEAIRVLKKLEAENHRPATWEERHTLARWSGWGSVPILFANEPNEKEPRYQQGGVRYGKFAKDHERWSEYSDIRSELQRVLTPVEFRQASRGVLSMHYTPQPIAEAMWEGLRAFGFERGEVLEAGSGAGTFFGVAPTGAYLTGVELDPTTARIAQTIYPHANVLNESFAETDARPGTFDAAIGNVPFARVPFDDKRYPAESLHNGFITKEIALVRPGGITAVITSRQTLDSKGDKARRQMAKYGDLVGAVRLPSGVFNDVGTGVTTDVLVFRRREDGAELADTSWLDAPERDINGTPHHINAYFDEHPEHILGTLTTQSGPYGPEVTVKGDPAKAAEQLRAALDDIATKAKADGRGYEPHPDGDNRMPVQLQTAREKHANDWTGRLYEGDDGQFYQHVNGAEPVLLEPADGNTAQLRVLMQLRDVAAELRELDRKNDEEERAEALRAQLRDLHADYVAEYGPLSKPGQHRTKSGRPTAWGYFRADPDAAAVLALERWDAAKGEPVLSRVFTERAAARRQPLSATDDPKAALAAVVAAKGEVDLGEIARLLDIDPQEALKRLGNEVFTDPETGRLELASAYLSGAVRDKLDDARKAAERDPAYAVNVAALEAVQPQDRTIGQFTPEMGAHWTPPELLQSFLREYLGDRTLRVAHDDRYGWILNTGRVPEANNVMYGVPAVARDPEKGIKGNKGKNAVEITRAILGFGSLTVYEDDKRKEVDEATSRLIRQKADQMRAEFAKYATANAERLSVLTDSYNRIMNGHIVRSYEGMAPTLEGYTPDRTPHRWQLSGAARMQFERGVILAHEVGLGKTGTLVMGTQALKASGQIEKPMAVVPNHLAKQWADEARLVYPNADIHLITSADLAGDRRGSTLEWLRANKPDLVIFTEEAFGSIKMSPEAQDEYEFRELEALREQLDRQYEDADNPNHPFIVAKIEQRIATVQKNINKNAAPMRKPGETYWDDLGFDYFVVDEAHRYKGVGFRSKEAGGDPASLRGVDLHQKTTDLHRRRQGRATITLATGTPLSNSISEQFTMLQFAAPWVLDAYKAGAPDLWANTFGRKTLRIENAPDGSGLRVVERFSEFHNKRAMKTMWGLVADTKRADDVGIPRPKVKGGAPNLIMVDATPDQKQRLKGLVARGRAIHNGEVDRHQDNMLAVSNEGTSVALDPRLIDANAPAGNKLKAVADRHIERYHQHKDRVYKVAYGSDEDHPVPGALQMIFLNEGVPGGNNKGNFDAYAELKRLMVAGGIPEDKIAFVQDAKKSGKPEDMTELFRRAREGEIAVMIGSSAVAGTGMNAQARMVSLSHVDLDWGAAQMEQRNGRVLRYGNMNPEVEIDIFATKGSMDGWKAGFVAAKAEGLVDIQRPEPEDGDSSDVVQEIDGAEFDYETMEAEIGGNPYMSQLMKAKRRLKDLEIDQHNEAAERIRRAEALDELSQEAQATRDGIQRREQALPRIQEADDRFRMTISGSPYGERADAGKALHREITSRLLEHDREGLSDWHILGQFRGLDFGVRTERDADGKLLAHVGFPDLRHSNFARTVEDLKKRGAGSGMITRLGNALDKAPALQESDRVKVPELDEQIALLQSAHAAADLTPQIDHARKRSNLLEEIVARITDLDAKPEIDPDELDKERYKNKEDREKISKGRREEREPLQAAVDEAVAALTQWDRENPAPEQDDTVRLSEDEVREALARIRPEPNDAPETGTPATNSGDDTTDTDTDVDVPDTDTPAAGGTGDGEDEPPADIPSPADSSDEGDDEEQDAAVRLSEDEVNNTLASIRPADSADAAADTADAEEQDEGLQYAWDKPEDFVTLTMPAALVDFLNVDETAAMEDPDTRKALKEAKPGRRGTLQVTGPIDVHRALLRWAWALEGGEGLESDPAEMRAYRAYTKRVDEADAELRRRRAEAEANATDQEETNAPETGDTGNGGNDEPPADVPSPAEPGDENDDQEQETDQSDADGPEDSGTVTLTPDEVSDQLDAVRPEGSKAPSSMDDGEIRDEIVDLMGREMAGELSGADRTRLQVLEAEEARRAGRAPKREEKPKPKQTEEPGGLFDVDEPTTRQADSAADPDNPEDRPDDELGTPDLIAALEGRDTSDLRPARMRNAAELERGDRYTDADGRTHTVAEPPVRTPRGRTRIVTDDGEERFYNADAEVRLRYPDEEIPDNDTDDQSAPDAEGTPADVDEPAVDEPENTPDTDVNEPEGTPDSGRSDVKDRTDRMASLVERALNAAGGDALPEIRDLSDAMDRAENSDDPDVELRDIADRLDSLAEMYELGGPRGKRAAELFRRAARIARGEDDASNDRRDDDNRDEDETDAPAAADGDTEEDQDQGEDRTQEDENDDERRQQRRDGDADGGAADPEGSPSGGGAGTPDVPADDEDDSDGPDDEQNEPDAEDEQNDRDRNRRRRRRRRDGGGGGGNGGPGGPGGPGLPHLNLPDFNTPDASGDSGNGSDARDRDRTPARHRDVDSLRRAWKNGDGLTAAEDTPQRRAALAEAADREGLALSPGGGLVTWPERQEDGTTLWHFAQARNGNNLPGLSLATEDPEEARALAARFEEITGRDGQPFDWHQPWGPSTVAQWRDAEGRNLQRALHATRDDFEQQRAAQPTDEPERRPLPDDLTGLDDDELVAAWNNDLSPEDQARLMAEMDRRDGYTDQRVRGVLPDTPPADAEEAAQRARAVDEALGFNGADVPRIRRTREDIIRAAFADFDEARYQAAIEATNGYFYKKKYKYSSGINERELFSGGGLARFARWEEYASEELRNWFKANGGRITYNQFRQQYRDNDRRDRQQFEEEQRQQAEAQQATPTAPETEPYDPATPRFADTEALRDHIRNGHLDEVAEDQQADVPSAEERTEIADADSTQLSDGGRLLIYGNEAARADVGRGQQFNVALPGSMQPLFRGGFRSEADAREAAQVLEGITDADGNPFPWDAPDVAERARSFRSANGNTLFGEAAERMNGVGNRYEQWNSDLGQALHHRTWRQQEADWHALEEEAGYTVPVDPADLRPGDEISFPLATSRGQNTRPQDEYVGTVHVTVTGEGEPFRYRSEFSPFGNPQLYRFPAEGSWTDQYGNHREVTDAFPNLGVVRRRPRPDELSSTDDSRDGRSSRATTPQPETPNTAAPAARPEPAPDRAPAKPEPAAPSAPADEPQGEPEPVGGQPAHWARVGDLVPGDMVRMDGRTRNGRAVTRSGYVFTSPVRVETTRNGRTEHMWRTYVTANPDGTGNHGNVFTPLNATAARAQAPDDVVPGSPASGAQSAIQTGNLPDVVPADRNGRGLFPGSTVTGVDGLQTREGTVTGATNTTVSVRWDNGDTADGLSPTTLTVTGGDRPDGWTASGQRVTPRHIVTDTDGALLGPVDEVNGDRVTITTAEGQITRSAGDLRVSGEVRDDAPDTDPVTGVNDLAAADIKENDVVVLDLDGTLTTVAVTGVSRDGDRVTVDYADTTTGEMGQIDMDAAAIVPRAQGDDGSTPELGPDDAPETRDDLTVHEPPHPVDPVTGPTVDPELTMGDRDAIADLADGPDDDPDVQQAAVRITADLPVTPDQATALATQLREGADPSTPEGRAALRAADHLDRAVGRTPPAELGRPRPSNAAQVAEGDTIAIPDARGNGVRIYIVRGVQDGPGGVRSLLLEGEDGRTRRRVVHGAMPLWQLSEAQSDTDDTALVPAGPDAPRDPNPAPQTSADQIVADHPRAVAARIIDEAIAGTEPPGDIHALREQIAQRLTAEALRGARRTGSRNAAAALTAAGVTGRDRAAALQALKRARQEAHAHTVRAALRTINDLEPLPDESDEDLAARARDLLSLIPDEVSRAAAARDLLRSRRGTPAAGPGGDNGDDADVARTVTGHADDAVNTLLQQLQAAGVDPGDAERIARLITQRTNDTRQATAQQIARRVAAVSPQAGRQPGLLARIVAALIRLAKRLAELVRAGARKIAEKWQAARERLRRLRAFLGRLVRRVRQWPEARRLARLHRALDLPGADGESLAARVSHWAALMPETGRFGQTQRRATWWKPTTWAQLAAGRLPGRSTSTRWAPDRAADGGPGLAALRHMAALRAAGGDVDQEVTRRLADALGDDFGGDPHGTLQRADDYVALTERRLVNLQAARTGGTLPDDPDLEVEITAARTEASAARREWADLRAQYAAAVPDAVAAALAEIRDMGPEGNAGIVFGPDSNPDAERAVRAVQRLIPRSWLNTPAARRVTAVDGDEGRYEPDGQRITVADLADDGLGTSGHALAQHLAQHLGDLDAAQRAYWFTQTHEGRPGARRMRRSALNRLLRRQQTQPDTGDTLARSVQSMFSGDWYLDDDLRAFLLGLMATR
ncbi:SNF2-related protein [Streptomyces bobili]|uniref:DEAD/DEAH box helicase family protein n=1 Tax=Streptomyces bobili TaxID=67280 RepID=A0ABZ1R5B0_9ACTN|nr:SNF2-related protein [Streptomyces bobili]